MKGELLPLPQDVNLSEDLPAILYEDSCFKVQVIATDSSVLDKFGVSRSNNKLLLHSHHNFLSQKGQVCLLRSNATLSLEAAKQSPTDYRDYIHFALEVLASTSWVLSAKYTNDFGAPQWALLQTGASWVSRRSDHKLDTARFATMLEALCNSDIDKAKLRTLMGLYRTAMTQVGALDLQGALLVSVLEFIFICDEEKERVVKLFIERIHTYRSETYSKSGLDKLYDKRSKVLHGVAKGDVFTKEEVAKLEEFVCECVYEYIISPKQFTDNRLRGLFKLQRKDLTCVHCQKKCGHSKLSNP